MNATAQILSTGRIWQTRVNFQVEVAVDPQVTVTGLTWSSFYEYNITHYRGDGLVLNSWGDVFRTR